MFSGLVSHLILLIFRAGCFVGCKRYVHRSLLTDLKQVITDDTTITSTPTANSSPKLVQSDSDLLATDSTQTPLEPNLKKKSKLSQWLSSTSPPSKSKPLELPANNLQRQQQQQQISSTIATLLFCWTFCEGSLLFGIVILGSWLDTQARNINWNLSLGLLISSVVFIVPFLECLLFSTSILAQKSNERVRLLSIRTVSLTCLPFGLYLFIYYRVGQTMQGLLGVESGSHSFGFLNTTLARICVPGVFLIASLSGGGAVNTAWETWEWHRREKEPPMTDQHIETAEQALRRTRLELSERKLSLQQSSHSDPEGSGASIMKAFSGSSNIKLTHLMQEISGLQAMEHQMMVDLKRLKERKEYSEYLRTIPGMMLNIANWSLSIYCVYRLFMACVNLIFGYVRRPSADSAGNMTRNPTTDVVTYLIAKILLAFNVELELTKLTRLVGLVLIGSIIIVNLRSVLVWVHRVFNRVSSRGVSSNLMLLVLGQLMAMYLLTCLISLPTSTSDGTKELSSTAKLLNTLPSFSRFSRLFDGVFLATGMVTGVVRWLGKQINQEGDEEIVALNRMGGMYA